MAKAGRRSMAAGFGNVRFRLKVGEIGVAPWHATDNPFGWQALLIMTTIIAATC